jgi:hypothetical protein
MLPVSFGLKKSPAQIEGDYRRVTPKGDSPLLKKIGDKTTS